MPVSECYFRTYYGPHCFVLVRSSGYWHGKILRPKWLLTVIYVLMHFFAKLKLTYALQNSPKDLSVSSFEAPEVIPHNTARRTRTLSNWEAVSLGNRRASEGVVATVIVLWCPLHGLFPAKWKWAFERVVGFGIFGLGYALPAVSFPIIIATPSFQDDNDFSPRLSGVICY